MIGFTSKKLALALLASSALASPALAQVVFSKTERQAPDENGVDVISGVVNARGLQSITAGRADQSGLTYALGWAGGQFYDTFDVQLTAIGGGFQTIRILGQAKRFTQNPDGTFTNGEGDGATLIYTRSTGFTPTRLDGTVFTFLKSLGDTGWLALVTARVSTITKPNGEVDTYAWSIYAGRPACPRVRLWAYARGRANSVRHQQPWVSAEADLRIQHLRDWFGQRGLEASDQGHGDQ